MALVRDEMEAWAKREWREGDGLHTDIFAATCFLLERGYEAEQVFSVLRVCADQVGEREVPDRELRSAINYAVAKKIGGVSVSSRWSQSDPLFMAEVVKANPVDLERLRQNARSFEQNPSFFLPGLFHDYELLCVAADTWTYSTILRDDACNVAKDYALEFIVPSAMTSKTGLTVEGKESAHTKANTGSRVYLVVEFDQASKTDQIAFHKFLSRQAPLVLMLDSGGKSIHGWYLVEGWEEFKIQRLFDVACQLGADKKTWTPSQFIRMPGGRNNKYKTIQKVVYFSPVARPTTQQETNGQ